MLNDRMLSDKTLRLLNAGVDSSLLNNKYTSLKQQAEACIGYPTNQSFDYRELHPGGMVYFSEATHYSVAKILRL